MFRKFFTFIFIILLYSSVSLAQMILFQDDFETYVAGQRVACQDPVNWTTWTLVPCDTVEDPLISNAIAYSGVNSVNIISFNDLVYPIPDLITGKYSIRFMMYVPTGSDGYFNVLQDFAGASSQWGMQAYFPSGGTGSVDAGAASAAFFSFPHNSWFPVKVDVDLNSDWADFYVDNVFVIGWIWHLGTFGTGTLNQLGGVDMYGHDQTGTNTANYYFDNFEFWDLIIPVELTSFTANVNNEGHVVLNWTTATELNNLMFEVERRTEAEEYHTIGFVNGYGTTSEMQDYTYIDKTVSTGKYFYRLKQIDFQGTYEYSDEIEVDVKGPLTFSLGQNYPNPFNPVTNIKFSIPESGNIKLAVYNVVGEEVAVLVDEYKEAGFYEVAFNAVDLPSGAYLYKLQSSSSVEVKKMLLTK